MTEPGHFRRISNLKSETLTSSQRLYSCTFNEGTMTADFVSRKLHQPSVNDSYMNDHMNDQLQWMNLFKHRSLSDVFPTFKVHVKSGGVLEFFCFLFFLKVWTCLMSPKCVQMIQLRHSISPSDWQKKKAPVLLPLTALSHKSHFLAKCNHSYLFLSSLLAEK